MTQPILAAKSRVYFVQNTRTSQVKIGYSSEVRKRIGSLQTATPDRLILIRLIDGGPRTEAWLHKKFSNLHVRGEWFEYHDDMLVVCPPDELPQRAKVVQRRDIRLTLRERTVSAERLGAEIGLTAQQVVFSLSSGLSEDEAQSVLSLLRGETPS